ADRGDWEAVGQGGVKTGVAALGAAGAVAGIAGAVGRVAAGSGAAATHGSLPTWTKGQPTRGLLDTGQALIELWSGESGGPPALQLPGRNNTNFFHVEAHAAQIMRLEQVQSATLHINKVPCSVGPGCANNLPHMLPEGSTLRVVGPGGYNRTFVGRPDATDFPR
ncbi:MAG TPA: DddA-like double-stranded DNA deaminase toxin, partial [Candidatus Nanopelagicales bacterium]|nr:DddA-like double-stranded DNA deaminase toxin [Candidatus Nanopelagicales bacterium]